ncbi:unnamed protein product [Ambrosiozyma monospora]|uniref:Unnamed protein product n=1 Tax=Ambrosiozyma monospora TaxID=43982 RepID=A0ACB5TY25_AMBMO|nr:unnamed protein product [Ambrosiozyma monospora]
MTMAAPHLASSSSSDSVLKSQTLGTGPPHTNTAPPTTPKLNVSLFNKLLDQPNLLDEINLTKNQKLISYLSLAEVVEKMIDYILYSLTINPLDYNNPDTRDSLMVHDVFEGGNNIEEEGGNNNGADSQFDKLERAFQRASVCSEIMMLSNNALVSRLITNQELLTKIWRGFLDNQVKTFFTYEVKIPSTTNDTTTPNDSITASNESNDTITPNDVNDQKQTAFNDYKIQRESSPGVIQQFLEID